MDEVFSLDILYADEYVPEQLYQLVQDGLCSQLDARLHELSNSAEYLTALTWHGQERLSLLMVAALNGYDDIVRVLLTHCDSTRQIELKGQVILYDAKLVKDATALYCACYRGHFTVAKTLIELGQANVKQSTRDYPYYPLFIHATITNRQDIVHFLLENKYADVNETKSNDYDESTALIWAAFRGYTSLVKYLIENGADVDYSSRSKTLRGSTAVMCATLYGHVDALRLLYNAGANTNIKDDTGDSLLMTAVKYQHYSIVSFLLEQSINNTVDDLEFAACSLFDISSSIEQMNVVFDLLRVALQQRQLLQMSKICIQSMDIYDYQQECQTIDELDRIKANRDRMFIETLLIRERIYSSRKNITVIKPLENYGDRLTYKKEFDKCLNLYIHMFYLYQQIDMNNDLARFVWLFCKMLTENRIIPIHRFIQACYLTFELTESKYMEFTIRNALFLVIIATKVIISPFCI
jgi:ankyrin repeat protein